MAEPTPFAMAELFTDLIGCKVSFSRQTAPVVTKLKQIYGVYLVKPMDSTSVVQADLKLLGSCAGALIGLPSASVKERLASALLEEPLRDAIHEVLNIASTVVSLEHRAVFQKMYLDRVALPSPALDSLQHPTYRSYFNVTIDGYEGGAFSILATS